MSTLLHLSDLHFGRIEGAVIEPLIAAAARINPDLLIVSGDLTQRAKPKEFRAARTFLDALPFPRLVVPGNHDIPLFNLAWRLLQPLGSYRRYISEDIEPTYRSPEVVVVGMNSARSLAVKNGWITSPQIERVRRIFCNLPPDRIKVVACHHPFDLPESSRRQRVVGGAARAIAALAECGTDLVLSGHYHVSHAVCSVERYASAGYSMLLVAAGTATSTRLRGEDNTFNVIRLDPRRIEVIPYVWRFETHQFTELRHHVYEGTGEGWMVPDEESARVPAVVAVEA